MTSIFVRSRRDSVLLGGSLLDERDAAQSERKNENNRASLPREWGFHRPSFAGLRGTGDDRRASDNARRGRAAGPESCSASRNAQKSVLRNASATGATRGGAAGLAMSQRERSCLARHRRPCLAMKCRHPSSTRYQPSSRRQRGNGQGPMLAFTAASVRTPGSADRLDRGAGAPSPTAQKPNVFMFC